MNREWSDKNKLAQSKLKKASFNEGIREFLELREMLMQEMLSWKTVLSPEDFFAIPFINADGYLSKTVAYSIWHIIRIEDIVVNSLIREKKEILFEDDFDKKIGADIVTTGNELVKQEIAEFSKKLNIDALYDYAIAVKTSTDEWLTSLKYEDIKSKFDDDDNFLTVYSKTTMLKEYSKSVKLSLLLIEDNIIKPQAFSDHTDLEYTHNHVLRAGINEAAGEIISPNGYVQKDSCYYYGYSIDFSGTDWVPENCSVIAILWDQDNHEVLQTEKLKVK